MAILSLLWTLAVCGAIFWLCWWGLGKLNPPEPWNKAIVFVLVVVSIFVLINILLGAFIIPFPTITLK